jgi:hypothetical protein
MISASNLRLAKLAATRSGITSMEALIRPALATRLANSDHFLRTHSTVAVEKAPVNGKNTGEYITKPLKVLDSMAVERIKQELAEVDKNSDGRYVGATQSFASTIAVDEVSQPFKYHSSPTD